MWSDDRVRRAVNHWEFGACFAPSRPAAQLVAAEDLARGQTRSSEHNLLATLLVSPWDGGGGPAVRTSVALEIPVAKTGVTAIEGPNAAGKSVLLAAAAGILRLEQVRVVGLSDPDSPPILCSQYPELEIFEEKAGDEVVYAAVSRGVPRALALERAASLVVLDEPTVGLDSRRRLALAGLVEELSRRSTFLLASQDGAWLDGFAARRHRLGGPTLPSGANPGKKRIDKALS